MRLSLVHLYPALLNLYGDRGNIITLKQRCAWRGIELDVIEIGLGQDFPVSEPDLVFMGGDQDREQEIVIDDLRRRHGDRLRHSIQNGTPVLAVCGSYQLLQEYYKPAAGRELHGLGIIPAHTVHPGPGVPRCVGNIVIRWPLGTVVGFENHGGRTFLDAGVQPLGTVASGFGNNGDDGTEGARVHNLFGTYIHGSLLPKNPAFADLLLSLALARRYAGATLQPLDDTLERRAHDAAVSRAR
ncbi:MAG TPA: glutamine amidotransferase [Chloroflexota bacterium]|nr:glutamine amidotransferase [Chloroflexota bacterium]